MSAGKKLKSAACLFLLLLLISSGGAKKEYIPKPVDNYYPEIVFSDKSSSKAQWDSLKGGKSKELTSVYHLAPFGDFDGNNSLRIPIRTTSGTPYLKATNRTSGADYYGLDNEGSGDKPKSGMVLSTGRIDGDGTDTLFVNQNSNIAYIDENSYGTFSASSGGVVGTGDVDRDGFEEYAYVASSNKELKYYNFRSGDTDANPGSFGVSVSSKEAVSTLVDLDKDGRLEVAYKTGSSYLKAGDAFGEINSRFDDGLGNIKSYSMGVLWYDNDSYPEVAVAGNSNEMYFCNYNGGNGECQQTGNSNGFNTSLKKTKGTRSYIPVFTKTPETNASGGTIEKGKTIKIKFNATDWEGYTDIVNSTAKVKLKGPEGNTYRVDAEAFTANSKVPGTSAAGGFVPSDGKTKAFKATFKIPETANTGTWTATAKVKDEHMTGTLNRTSFEVKKALVEKNLTQKMFISQSGQRKARWSKITPTGLSFQTPTATLIDAQRILSRAFNFQHREPRYLELFPSVTTGVGLQRLQKNTKSTFPFFSSDLILNKALTSNYIFPRSKIDELVLETSSSGTKLVYSTVAQKLGLEGITERGAYSALFSLAIKLSDSKDADRSIRRIADLSVLFPQTTTFTADLNRYFSLAANIYGGEKGIGLLNRKQSTVFSQVTGLENLKFTEGELLQNFSITSTGTQNRTMPRTAEIIVKLFDENSRSAELARKLKLAVISESKTYQPNLYNVVQYTFSFQQNPAREGLKFLRTLLSGYQLTQGEKANLQAFRVQNHVLDLNSIKGGSKLVLSTYSPDFGFDGFYTGQAFFQETVVDLIQISGLKQNSKQIERLDQLSFKFSEVLNRESLVGRSLNLLFTVSDPVNVVTGAFKSFFQDLGLVDSRESLQEKNRVSDHNLFLTSTFDTTKSLFRTFTQVISTDLGLGELIEYIMEFFDTESTETSDGTETSTGFLSYEENKSKEQNQNKTKEKPDENRTAKKKPDKNRLKHNFTRKIEFENGSLVFDSPLNSSNLTVKIRYKAYSITGNIVEKGLLKVEGGGEVAEDLNVSKEKVAKISGIIKLPNSTRSFAKSLKANQGREKASKPEKDSSTFVDLGADEISLILILASVFLLRDMIISFIFSIDLRIKKAYLLAEKKFLELDRRARWVWKASTGRKEYKIASKVKSLENKKELLEFRKSEMKDDIEKLEDKQRIYKEQLKQLSEKIESWEKLLDKNS